jgi:MFS family permease
VQNADGGGAHARGALPARIVVLLALAMFVNYADRGSLSVVAPVLHDQLRLSDAEMGVLLSSFFWSYTLAQPLAGSIVQRFDVRWVLAVALALWAGATMLCGLAVGYVALLGLRLAMGLGESVIYPANAQILAERADERVRGRCNGLISMAMCLGPTGGTLVGGLVLAHYGWRAVFLCLGLLSLLWLWPWLTTPREAPAAAAVRAKPSGPGYGELLGRRALWGASIGQLCYSWQFYLLLTWLPSYLVKAQHLSLSAMAGTGAAVYAVQALAALASGWVTDALVRRGSGRAGVRRIFLLLAIAGGGLALLVEGLGPKGLAIPCLFLAGICTGWGNPLIFSIGQTLAGPSAGGRWMGIQNMGGNFAGILAPIATGVIAQITGSFTGAFVLAAALSVVGIVCWSLVLGPVETLTWRRGGAALQPLAAARLS